MEQSSLQAQCAVVLVRPLYPFNIGATARAMHNMGLSRLILVAPACEIDHKVREGAANAQEILAKRTVYSSMEEFYATEGDGLRIAFTRRAGERRYVGGFSEFVKNDFVPKYKELYQNTPVYLLFGSEDAGLSFEETELANHLCSLKTFGENGSYNLAQSVLLALYILMNELTEAGLLTPTDAIVKSGGRTPSEHQVEPKPVEYPSDLVVKWLEALGFNFEHFQRKNASTVLNSLFLRAVPSRDEIRLLASVLHQNIRKLTDRKQDKTNSFKPIGVIETPFKTRFGIPRQPGLVPEAWGKLRISRELQPELALDKLSEFSHAWVIFVFHENTNRQIKPKVHPPRLEGETIGVFASRSPHRPNPIGLSVLKIKKVEGDTVYFEGTDLLDGTPVLDIKPYVAYSDSIPDAKSSYAELPPAKKLTVIWDDQAKKEVKKEHLLGLIEGVLGQDPRPLVYKHAANTNLQNHAVYIEDMDIHFEISDSTNEVKITSISPIKNWKNNTDSEILS